MEKSGHEYPHFYLFFGLWGLSFIYFLFFAGDDALKGTGFLVILWSMLLIGRITWLSSVFVPEEGAAPARFSLLPRNLLRDMQTRQKQRRGFLALNTVSPALGLFFLLGSLYIATSLFSALWGMEDVGIAALNDEIENFFVQQNDSSPALHFYNWQIGLQNLAHIMILSLSFWLAQTYAVNKIHADHILWFGGLMFIVAFLRTTFQTVNIHGFVDYDIPYGFLGYGWGSLDIAARLDAGTAFFSPLSARIAETGLIASALLAMAFGVLLCVFLYYLRKGGAQKAYAGGGLLTLLALCLTDVVFVKSQSTMAVWLILYAVLGTLWIRARKGGTKMYIMRQL